MTRQTFHYQTEVQQLLDLVIHSLYSNKDIFLRELISNASDAIDKLRFESMTNQDLVGENADWKVKVAYDENAGTITVSDNGIGMSQQEVIENIGTIARSGTKAFLHQLKELKAQDSPELIGQFGVGFYSTFMVADKVIIITRKAGCEEKGVIWESTGDGTYTIDGISKPEHGTNVVLHLKEDAREYLSEWKLREIIKKYSDYVEHAIVMDVTREKDEGEGEKKTSKTEIIEETINSRKAIWAKNKNEVSEEEYKDFYRHISHDFHDPLETIHYRAEGTQEFKALLYIPSRQPVDIFWKDYKGGLNLYIKRVFIMHDCTKLIPEYLRFMRGVVDSSDLPLNVSREILQDSAGIERIKKNVTKKVLKTLQGMLENDREKYISFYRELGTVLKEGLHFDFDNKDTLKDLLLFESTATELGTYVTLKEYKERMPKDQKNIFYIAGEDRRELAVSPLLEAFRKKGYEVLFMTDRIDEFVIPYLVEYDGVQLQSVEKGDLELDKEVKEKKEKKEKEYRDLLAVIKEALKDDVKEVRFSTRLTDSASCLVADEQGMSKQVEMMLRQMGQEVPANRRILELNPDHRIVEIMQDMFDKEKGNQQLKDYAHLLYDQALIAEGSKVQDPQRFARLVSELMVSAAHK